MCESGNMTASRDDGDGGRHAGSLFIVGGAEDREDEKEVLRRFVELSGGKGGAIVVLTAASNNPDKVWTTYDSALTDLGVEAHSRMHVDTRTEADDPRLAAQVARADGIFIAGGDQKRLVSIIGGTALHSALHRARARGACLGGTSAGASAMSVHMLAQGRPQDLPEKQAARLSAGLGFLSHIVIDQHFSQRHRLPRLLSVIAENPGLLGVGIDEDTALLIEPDSGIEVIGAGAITILDGRRMMSNFRDINARDTLELINVCLHLLPAGVRYDLSTTAGGPAAHPAPEPLRDVLSLMTRICHEDH